jgi:predicted nucleic acid-binding protein
VYLDTDVLMHVLLDQEHAEVCSSVLEAAVRGDVALVASRYLMVEVGAWYPNRPGLGEATALVETFLEGTDTEWVEVDVLAAREAQKVAWEYHLRAGDSIHLATALRRNVDYFMTYDTRFPIGTTIGSTTVMRPKIVWQPTLFDASAD